MMDFFIKEIVCNEIEKELQKIGFDEGYRYIAANKFKYKNFKIFNLNTAQANILKQTALTVGADCATNRNVITGNIDRSDVLIGGNISQLKKICDKLKHQPFNLPQVGDNIIKLLQFNAPKTKLVGILNVTPDSFSDGGLYQKPIDAQKHIAEMIDDGADMIDIGAESTRPYSEPVSDEEQIRRLKPVLEFIQKENITVPISIDTRSSKVAHFALNNAVSVINDVSGFDNDNKMADIIAEFNAGIVIQHSLGTPQNMQAQPKYFDVIDDIYKSLKSKIEYANSLGINKIIVDPGIGFGKTKQNNLEILDRITEFNSLNYPIMVGISRKSFLGVSSNNNALKDTLSAAISYPLIKSGVDYLRVHNVKLHKHLLNL